MVNSTRCIHTRTVRTFGSCYTFSMPFTVENRVLPFLLVVVRLVPYFVLCFVAPSSSMRLIRSGLDPQFFDAFSSFFNKPIVVRFSCVQQYNNTYVLHADVVQMSKHTSMYDCDQVQLFVCLGAFLCVWRCHMYFLHSRWGGIYSYSWSRFSTFGDSMLFWFSLLGQTRGRETLLDTLLNCFVFTMLHSVCSIRRKTTGVIGSWTW